MLIDIFKNIFKKYNVSQKDMLQLCNEIVDEYNENIRFYNNLNHIFFVVNKLLETENLLIGVDSTLLAAFYHDFVYDTSLKNNEIKSADFAYKRLINVGLQQ